MDLVTHAVMGASLAAGAASALRAAPEAVLSRRRNAAVAGALAGVLPDVDALIQSGGDALLVLDYHRHFTHALAFVPLGALVAALLLWPILRARMRAAELYVFCLCGYLPHPLLDACTSYGTHLWLPFSTRKEAWSLIAVVDPMFTLGLAIPLWLFLRRRVSRALRWSAVLGVAYLGIAGVQQWRVETAAAAVARTRGDAPSQLAAKPSMGNLVLWRVLYVSGGRMQADAFHAGLRLRHYPGGSAALLDAAEAATIAAGETTRQRDIERFRTFSDGMVARDPRQPQAVGDIRYAMLPNAIAPIWGISWSAPGAPTVFSSRHDFPPAARHAFLAMLAGRDLPADGPR